MVSSGRLRAGHRWLALREPADASARVAELVDEVRGFLPPGGVTIHDLGCGTGSMARWLAPRLPGPQHWVLHDQDSDLLRLARANLPKPASDGASVTLETRLHDVTRLDSVELAEASMVTASALLDTLTADELDRLVWSCVRACCAVLVTLSVTGRVELMPADPFDQCVSDAFNAHQRRSVDGVALLGPDAVEAAADRFDRMGLEVLLRPSPWHLGPDRRALVAEWFTGWLSAACEQQPELRRTAASYSRWRQREAATGRLSVTVHHLDLLARPVRAAAAAPAVHRPYAPPPR